MTTPDKQGLTRGPNTNPIEVVDYATGAKGSYCLCQRVAGAPAYHAFWNPDGWAGSGYVFTDKKLAEAVAKLLASRAPAPETAGADAIVEACQSECSPEKLSLRYTGGPSHTRRDAWQECVDAIEKLKGKLAAPPAPADKMVEALRGLCDETELHRGQIAQAVVAIKKELDARDWLTQGRGSYTYDDDRWHDEFGAAINAIRELLVPLEKIGASFSDRTALSAIEQGRGAGTEKDNG